MSIILKGIDMPKEGEHIVTLIKSNGKCSYWKQETEYGICEPMQTVEATQIPTPHGRLIDADALKESIEEVDRPSGYTALVHIQYAPTIIEAEE